MQGVILAHEKPRRRFRLFSEGLERINAFSDGIFAIAITLLVIDIHVPELTNKNQLLDTLWDLRYRILFYALSFLIIGVFWMLHRGIFSYIRRFDARLLWLNNLFLLMIAFQPFPTAVLGEYGDTTVAVIFFAGVQLLSSFFKLLIWLYASHKHRLIDADLNDRFIRYNTMQSTSPLIIYSLSIGLAFVNPAIAEFSWLLFAVDGQIIRRFYPLEPREDEEFEDEVVVTDFGEVPAEIAPPSTPTPSPSAAEKESGPPSTDK
jgi:uncharacterized membrane protein